MQELCDLQAPFAASRSCLLIAAPLERLTFEAWADCTEAGSARILRSERLALMLPNACSYRTHSTCVAMARVKCAWPIEQLSELAEKRSCGRR